VSEPAKKGVMKLQIRISNTGQRRGQDMAVVFVGQAQASFPLLSDELS
jgi:hypothetical protein